MAIYQRCQQPTSRKVLLQLHQLPLFPACFFPFPRPLTARPPPRGYKSFRRWRRGRAAATATRWGKQHQNQKQIQVPPPRPMEHDAALTRTSVYVKIQYVMHLVSCFPPSSLSLSLYRRAAKIVCLCRPGRPVG